MSHHRRSILADRNGSVCLVELSEGWRTHGQNRYTTIVTCKYSSVNIILGVLRDITLPKERVLSPDSEGYLYVGCHLSTCLLLSTCLGSVDVSYNDKGGTWSQQLGRALFGKYRS